MKIILKPVYVLIQIIYYFKQYFILERALKPFKNKGFIQFRPHNLYFNGYLSKSFPIKKRILIGAYHYNFLHNEFSSETVNKFFHNGITCWQEHKNNGKYSVNLKKEAYEGEGSLSLLFQFNDILLYFLRFSFGPDLDSLNNRAIYVGAIQGTRNIYHIKKASEFLDDIYPPKIVITILASIARVLGIKTIIGVGSENQLAFKPNDDQSKIYFSYESFYESIGGKRNKNGCYFISCPLQIKPIALIKQKHRSRALARRKKLQEISILSMTLLNKSMKGPFNQLTL
jgi:uncharacterized protein VirK/YbjX